MKYIGSLIAVAALSGCAAAPQTKDLFTKAEAGDPAAMFSLGARHDAGRGVPQDRLEAARWYRRSADAGFAEAQNSLGSLYQSGEGVPQDFAQARSWYEKAAGQGHLEGMHNLAFLHDEGLGTPNDNDKAIALYTKAAEAGFPRAMLNLGVMQLQGDGVPVNLVEAYKWLDLARFHTQSSRDMTLKWRARGLLDDVAKQMSSADITKAKALARQWSRAHRGAD